MNERHHLPASETTIRQHLPGHPDWLIQECLDWTRDREARGHQFTDGSAAVQHWLDQHHAGPARTYWIPTAGAAGVEVTLPGILGQAPIWTCRGCDHVGTAYNALDAVAHAGTHAAMCGRGTAAVKMETDLATFRAELVRVDAKAATLLTVAGVALTVGLAVLGRAGLPTAAAVTGWLAVALLGAGVVLLALTIRPNLSGNHGFMRYVAVANAAELLADVAAQQNSRTPLSDLAEQIAWTARAAHSKYRRVRHAVTLLLVGLAATAVTALLALVLA